MRHLIFGAAVLAVIGCNGPSNVPPNLTITQIIPGSGLPEATTPVQIRGTGFMFESVVTIGGVVVPAKVESAALITTEAPPHAAGRVDIVVSNPRGNSATLRSAFNYAVPPPPAASGLVLTGNTSIANAGDTSQFTATATFVDGSSKDVSSAALWTVTGGTGVIRISSSGLVTATALGVANISVRYPATGVPSFTRSAMLKVTPPGTFVVYGRAREPGAGSLPGVLVQHLGTGQSVTTSPDGAYSFGGVTSAKMSFSRTGYEPVETDASFDAFFEVALQRVYRIEPEGSSTQVLAPNDMIYPVQQGADRCEPCHLVRLTSPTAGRITLHVNWSDNGPPINVWTSGGQRFNGSVRDATAELDVSAGETLLYVGRSVSSAQYFNHTTFTMTTGPLTTSR
jgi:hypothetical protein